MGPADQLDITGAKGGSSKPKTPVEAPDSLQSTNIGKILIAVGEGEFDGAPTDRDIFLDNTPIVDTSGNVNFPGVKWEWRPGSVEQDYIQGIPAIENETTVNVELRSDNPFARALSNTQLSAVRVRMVWPRLAQQDSSGNTNGYRIEYAIDIATDGGAYVEAHLGAVDGKTTNGYQRSVRVNLPKATSGWMLRVRRITPNANSGTVADTMTIAGYTEIIDEKLRYPNTALLYIEFDAQQFQNIPAVTVKCKAKRWPVPSNYDPIGRTYTGVWDGTFKQAWTNNPAFATYGICVEDRFGLGKRIKSWMVDKWEMYRIAQYCDQLVPNGQGGQEPRYLCDLNLQGRAEAWTLLRDLSAIYRGMVYWAHGSLFMQADMPRAQDIDYVFTRANVIDGEFVYGGAERNTHYSRALVSYDNPANNYDTDVIPVTDLALQRRYRDRPVEISAIGCTRASEAQRRGKWALLSNSQDRTVTFKTGMEGRIPLPGYVIPVADELVAGRPNGGRISAAAGRVVTLDRDTPIKAGDRLILNLPNGTAQARTVQSVAGRAVTVTTAYGVQPEPELQWAIDYDDLAVQLFRVLKTTRTQEGEYEITALEFNPSKFAAIDTGAKLDERPISVIPVTTVQPPASVTLSSAHMIDQGIAVSTMTIVWAAVEGAVAYDVEWRKDNGNWVSLQRVGTTSVDVVGIYAGAYLARVRAVSAFDITSIWKSSVLTQLNGKEGLPPAVTFLDTESLLFGIGIKWGFPAGAEDTQRTELWYSEGTDLGLATKLADLSYPQNEYVMQGLRAGQRFYFWARLVDRSGNIGPFFPVEGTLVSGMASADATAILEQIKDQITESELGQELTKRIDLIDMNGPGSVNERLGGVRSDLDQQIADTNNAVAEVDSALTAAKDSLTEAQASLSEALAEAQSDLQEQIDQIADLADSMPYKPDQAYTAGQGVLGEDGKLYQAKGNVPAGNPPPNATYWTDIGQAVQTANGLAVRVQTVETKVQTLEGTTTAQSQQITGLQSSLTTTNGNVTSAQQAAQAASDLAGSKGKVIVQATAPAAADRIAQNLWIDTTGNANTPKRWNGSAWVAVTDKVASDAAAAAANALAVAQTKADANAVQSLTTRVTNVEGVTTAQGQSLTGLQSSLTTTNQNVSAAQAAADAANTLAGGKGKVIVQSAAPAVADRLAQNLWIDTTGSANTPKRWNGSAWVAVTDKVATDAAAAAANALAVAQTKADASAVQSLTTKVTDVEGAVTAQGQSLTGLQSSLTTTNQNVTAAQQAAQDAATLAGGKGKVIVQAAAPAVADRLAQNLWIDTTNNANTPKRWNGSAWVAVTDKVATDAAAAAAAANALAATKADASTVNSLGSAVSQLGDTVSAQGQSITAINTSIGQVGGENWIYNPSFEKQGTNGLADGWAIAGASGVSTTPSIVSSALAAGEMAQRIDITGLSASAWSRIGNPSARRIEVNAGAPITMSAYVRGTPGLSVRCEIQFLNSAGGAVSGPPVAANTSLTAEYARISYSVVVPQGAVRCNYFVTCYGTASINAGFMEVDRTQIEFSSVMSGWHDNGAVNAGALAATSSAVQEITGRVEQTESSLTAQSQQITGLQSGLTTTNQNVTAAQQAAQAASDAAGAKGKVLYQSTAPAVADRLTQNLWIDTTGNANTPKRWNGSAWVAVTDKVATDAAAAAASALTQVANKADASTVQSLSNAVEQHGTAITANGQAITNINTSLTGLGGGKANLLPAEYSVFGPTLPALSGTSFTMGSVADPAALRGYALKLDWTSTSTSLAVHFSTSVAAAGMNMAFRNKRYIVSYYAKASVAGHQVANFIRVLQADGSSTVTGPAALVTLGTDWARYSAVIDMTAVTFTGSRMQLSFQMNRSGVADRSVWLDRIMIEEAAEGATAPSAFVPGSSFDQSQLNAEATSALTGRVSQTEQGLTSVSSNVTSLANSIGQVGGENWIYNPSFEKQGTVSLSDGWAIAGGSGAAVTPSRVASAIAPGEIAQRIDVTGISPSVWARIGNPSTRRITVTPGTPVTMSAYVRGTPGLNVRCEIQFLNSAGGGISGTPVATNTPATSDFNRIAHSVIAPNEAVQCNFFVTCYGTASISNAFMEVDRTQIEFSPTASGWKDNGKVATTEQGALSTAVDSLSSAVSQQGSTLTSVGNRTTALENSVNNASTGLATKASASSVTAIGNRVTATEGSLASASSNITDLQNTLGGMNGGVNLIPAEYSVFGPTPPAMNRQSNLSASTIANAGAAGKFLLKLESTVSQVNYFYLAASGTDWTMKLKPGKKYILSFWAQADAARAMSLRIRYPNAAGTNIEVELAQVNVTTALTRVSAVMTMPAALVENCCLVFYQARTASASTHWYDGFMLEEQAGGNEAPSSFSVGSSARDTQATSRALNEMSSTVAAQGETISAQAQSISGLQTSVGNNAAAIQNEATARTNADSALSQQIQTTQSSLGDTNSSVQQLSTAHAALDQRANATYTVKLQATASGQYVAAGFGLGLVNNGGMFQSTFAVMVDRFAVLNPAGNGFVSPFAIQNNQVFMNDAFIRDASITNAKIADAAITNAKIGVAEIDTLRIRGNAVTVPVSVTNNTTVYGSGIGNWIDLAAVAMTLDTAGYIQAIFGCYQGFGGGIRQYRFRLWVNSTLIAEGGGDWADGFPSLQGAVYAGPGQHVISVSWWGENSGVSVSGMNIFAMGAKR
ncbi:hypothetical protein X970_11170 [Pseudomonas monteilii SB3101]|uniref:Uncharacterized protein n=3 Tax=Pseudomonas TaxID=286 RepID=V9UZ22_9PSED|nr:DUF1983 domain-containing protein [Pseudomonas monteilii]AHC82537.1 hypothetical protein X969_11515 [Pseudomonas monteilii SB3078]AHC87916.1 hypothetical protein X970_11170 [Pseudomonas monteilii SB3101]